MEKGENSYPSSVSRRSKKKRMSLSSRTEDEPREPHAYAIANVRTLETSACELRSWTTRSFIVSFGETEPSMPSDRHRDAGGRGIATDRYRSPPVAVGLSPSRCHESASTVILPKMRQMPFFRSRPRDSVWTLRRDSSRQTSSLVENVFVLQCQMCKSLCSHFLVFSFLCSREKSLRF